jgi:hypothetical protein
MSRSLRAYDTSHLGFDDAAKVASLEPPNPDCPRLRMRGLKKTSSKPR